MYDVHDDLMTNQSMRIVAEGEGEGKGKGES
jgi:hypothetical protein